MWKAIELDMVVVIMIDFFSSLKKDVIKIGLCYDLQILSQVPRDPYDIPVDLIISENRLIYCKNRNT